MINFEDLERKVLILQAGLGQGVPQPIDALILGVDLVDNGQLPPLILEY